MAARKKAKAKKKNLLPVTLSMRECTSRGWVVDLSERTIPGTVIRKDVFGLADCVAVGTGGPGTLYIQATSRSNHGARRKKALASPNLRPLLEDGNRFSIWSWVCTRGEEELWEEEFLLTDPDLEDSIRSKGITRRFDDENIWSFEVKTG